MASKVAYEPTGVQNLLTRASQLGYETSQNGKPNDSLVAKVQLLHTLIQEVAAAAKEADQRTQLLGDSNQQNGPNLGQMNLLLSELVSHLERVVDQKDTLVSYLQQPFTGDSIAVEHGSQQQFQELFKQMVSAIAALPTRLSAIDWATKFSLQGGLLDKRLSQLSTSVAKCQRLSETLSNLREAITSLTEQK